MKIISTAAAALLLTTGSVYAQGWNVDAFAGGSFTNTLAWQNVDYAVDAGYLVGAGISKSDVFIPNLELGFELNYSESIYNCCSPNSISGLAAMATAEYNVISTNNFEAYAGVGLGLVNVTYHNVAYTNSEAVFGGQVVIGGRYAISDNMKVFVEGRYLDTFTDAMVAGLGATDPAEYSQTAIVAGLRVGF